MYFYWMRFFCDLAMLLWVPELSCCQFFPLFSQSEAVKQFKLFYNPPSYMYFQEYYSIKSMIMTWPRLTFSYRYSKTWIEYSTIHLGHNMSVYEGLQFGFFILHNARKHLHINTGMKIMILIGQSHNNNVPITTLQGV